MNDHTDLITRLKAATGPSDELNCEIARALGVSWSWDEDGNYGPYKILPRRCRYLSSLDAAMGTARNLDEQWRMLRAMKNVASGGGDIPPPEPFFALCRAAMIVRLGGE